MSVLLICPACPLSRRRSAFRPTALLSRLAALFALVMTLPLLAWVALRSKLRGRPVFRPQLAVRPRWAGQGGRPEETLVYHELAGASGWLRRWPQLWSIVRGEFAWIGNRPLSPFQARCLENDFECLWLAAPLGVISLADAEGCADSFSVEARAHAAYYAARFDWRLNWRILGRVLFLWACGVPARKARQYLIRRLRLSPAA